MKKYIVTGTLCLILISQVCAIKNEANLEEFGFSSNVEKFRQRISISLQQDYGNQNQNRNIPSPILPQLTNNYSDLIPPPTKPKSRRYFQPRLQDHVPTNKKAFIDDRNRRIRNYKRPPAFNQFLEDHKNIALKIKSPTMHGLSGLFKTVSAEVLDKDEKIFYVGFSHTKFDRSLGQTIKGGSITKFEVPIGITVGLTDQFEMAVFGNLVNEKSLNVPIINDYEKTELEELSMFGKFQFIDNPVHNLKTAFGFGVMNAMGKQVTRRGSDGTSYTGFFSLTKNYETLSLHSQLGFTLASGFNASGNETPNLLYYNLGVEAPVSTNTNLTLEFNGLDWSGYGNNVDIIVGAKYRVRDEFSIQMAIPFSVLRSKLPFEYDNSLHIGVSIKI
ncbi:MAG: hypothetical protein COB02_15570 [Candidatus Cloacimonadota bacterium]|nr:MAG: hypothetical protein COB02_15570 [Candidatus Cloacimonadota bacterium]